MSTNARAMNARLKSYREVSARVQEAEQRIAVRALEVAVSLSPVGPRAGDGQFRGAWRLAGSREMAAPDTPDKDGAATVARGRADIAGLPPFSIVYLVNAMPYAGRLEHGWSAQAPQGVLGVTMMRLRDELAVGR